MSVGWIEDFFWRKVAFRQASVHTIHGKTLCENHHPNVCVFPSRPARIKLSGILYSLRSILPCVTLHSTYLYSLYSLPSLLHSSATHFFAQVPGLVFFLFLFFMYTRVHILGKYYRGVVGKSPMGNSSSSIFPGLVSLLILLPQGFSTRRSMERTRCIRLHPLQNININTFCKSIRGVACGYVYFDFDVGVRLSLRDLL